MTFELAEGMVIRYVDRGFPQFGIVMGKVSDREYWVSPSSFAISALGMIMYRTVVHCKMVQRVYHE